MARRTHARTDVYVGDDLAWARASLTYDDRKAIIRIRHSGTTVLEATEVNLLSETKGAAKETIRSFCAVVDGETVGLTAITASCGCSK